MRTLKIALLATVAAAALSSATLAADLVIEPVPVIDNTYGYDWDGPYAGLWIGGISNPNVFALGADLGVNALLDSNLLVGVEGNLNWESGYTWTVQAHGRLGFVTDFALLYALAGVGFSGPGGGFIPLGIGAEFGVGDNMSLKAEYNYQWGPDRHVAKVGFNWGF